MTTPATILVVRGAPTDAELAALTAVIGALLASTPEQPVPATRRANWCQEDGRHPPTWQR